MYISNTCAYLIRAWCPLPWCTGLNSIVPVDLLGMFSENELEVREFFNHNNFYLNNRQGITHTSVININHCAVSMWCSSYQHVVYAISSWHVAWHKQAYGVHEPEHNVRSSPQSCSCVGQAPWASTISNSTPLWDHRRHIFAQFWDGFGLQSGHSLRTRWPNCFSSPLGHHSCPWADSRTWTPNLQS